MHKRVRRRAAISDMVFCRIAVWQRPRNWGLLLLGQERSEGIRQPFLRYRCPPPLAGERIGRFMSVTVAWFSPVLSTRARYRLAALEATAAGEDLFGAPVLDEGWGLDMSATGERLVQILGCFFMCVQGFIEHLLCFVRRDISDGAVKTLGCCTNRPISTFPIQAGPLISMGPVTL